MYVDTNNKRTEQNSEMLATCKLDFVSPGTRAKLHTIYDNLKIGRMVYGELVFKVLMNKAIVNNKHTTRYLQDNYNNLTSYMNTCNYDIAKFILEWRNVVSFLEARGMALTEKFKFCGAPLSSASTPNFLSTRDTSNITTRRTIPQRHISPLTSF